MEKGCPYGRLSNKRLGFSEFTGVLESFLLIAAKICEFLKNGG